MAYLPRKHFTAAGTFIFALDTRRYLFLLRSDERYENTWALAGGQIEPRETILTGLNRECQEEIGQVPDWIKICPVETFTSPDTRFTYHTYFGVVQSEFLPVLNCEHHGYAWVASEQWPRPLHPGLWSTVQIAEVQAKIRQLEANY